MRERDRPFHSSLGFDVLRARVCGAVPALVLLLALTIRSSAEWPEGYVVPKDTLSPDGRFGIAMPDHETGEVIENANNYFADVRINRFVGEILQANLFEGQNHRSLGVTWAADSTWCVATYYDRFGFDRVVVLEPTASKLRQRPLDDHIKHALSRAIGAQAHKETLHADASLNVRLFPGRKVGVRAVASTNPKRREERTTYYAFFAGTYDVQRKTWLLSRARALGPEGDEIPDRVFTLYSRNEYIVIEDREKEAVPEDFTGTVVSSEEEKAPELEERLTEVYRSAEILLSSARFQRLKVGQIAWLKQREGLGGAAEKNRATETRIQALQELLWLD